MSLMAAMEIAASGMTAQRARLEMIVQNLANARTTRTAEGGPYRRRDVVFEAAPPRLDFGEELARRVEGGAGVRVAGTVVDPRPFVRAYDPGHPDADADGYVALPNVNPVEEIVNLVAAARSYEASLAAATIARGLVERSIELGR